MAGDSLEHGDDQKEGGGEGHENRVNNVVLPAFYHITAAQDWSNKTNFIFI